MKNDKSPYSVATEAVEEAKKANLKMGRVEDNTKLRNCLDPTIEMCALQEDEETTDSQILIVDEKTPKWILKIISFLESHGYIRRIKE